MSLIYRVRTDGVLDSPININARLGDTFYEACVYNVLSIPSECFITHAQ